MKSLELLSLSLILIAATDIVLVIAHLIVSGSVSRLGRINMNTRTWVEAREECRRLLLSWLALLCFVQIILLSIGSSIIERDIFVLYSYIADISDQLMISGLWSRLITVLSVMSIFGLLVLLHAIKNIFNYEPQALWTAWGSPIFRQPRKRYFITSHAFLDLCAALCVLMSCSHACYGTDVANIIKLKLVMGFFAILLFAAGTATWIYAVLNWQLRSFRDRAEFRLASA